MTKDELRQLIQESMKEVLNERRDFDYLTDDIPNRSIIGESWNTLIWKLGTLMDEVQDFNSTFGYTMRKMGMKEKLAVQSYMAQLQQIVQTLEQLHPAIKVMTDVEKYDELHEAHPHGRYAQQAGATPFQPPGDQAINEQSLLGTCKDESLVDDIFGSVSEFARQVEEHGDNFTYKNISVKYDPNSDTHYFYQMPR